jgi:cytochrome c553
MKHSASTIWLPVVAVLGAVGVPARAGESTTSDVVDAQASAQTMVTHVCETCHGKNGNSTDTSVPSLAGQGSTYLRSQLAAFQAQRRVGVMSGIAMNLSNTDIREAARYFSQQILQPHPARTVDSNDLRRGQAIYDVGIAATNVLACASCHALDGAGLPSEFPRLAGQHSRYIAAQLRAFRSDSRLSTNTMMQSVAAKLSDDEIVAVADYIESLQTNYVRGRPGETQE